MDYNKQISEILWDVAVIGGGASGMMAAGRAAERGARVILIEKNETLGKKLLITGGGRCNVTNAEFDNRILLKKFKQADKYLFSAFSKWSVQQTLDFFHLHNMETKVEALQRVFPVSDKAQSVWNVLFEYMQKGNVTIVSKTSVTDLIVEGNTIVGVKTKDKTIIKAREYIVATGGTSRPETGSTGDGFNWLSKIGHTIIAPDPSLVPIVIENSWTKRLQGVTFPDVKISLIQNDVKQSIHKGKILFTHFGISGPTVLNLSGEVGELLKYGKVVLSLDIVPQFDHGSLNAKLQEVFKDHSNKKIKNSLTSFLPSSIVPIIIEQSHIDPETWSHSVTREQRLTLITTIKHIHLNVKGLLGVEKAIITSGGVSLDEVDFKTMRSRLFPNLFLIGDILNIDRPSGGYSLQLCWTTGFVAGDSVILHS